MVGTFAERPGDRAQVLEDAAAELLEVGHATAAAAHMRNAATLWCNDGNLERAEMVARGALMVLQAYYSDGLGQPSSSSAAAAAASSTTTLPNSSVRESA